MAIERGERESDRRAAHRRKVIIKRYTSMSMSNTWHEKAARAHHTQKRTDEFRRSGWCPQSFHLLTSIFLGGVLIYERRVSSVMLMQMGHDG
jgi:hypothetical protein